MLQNENEIIKKACLGDNDAFEKLYSEYESMVYSTAYYMTKNSEDAADISQDVFIKVYKSLPNFRGECKFSSWIYRVCVNTVNDHMRKHKRQKTVSLSVYDEDSDEESQLDIPVEDIDALPEAALEKSNTQEMIKKAISELPEDMRTIVVLRDIYGYSYDELCRILSLKEGTVKSRINRARNILKEKLSLMFSEST